MKTAKEWADDLFASACSGGLIFPVLEDTIRKIQADAIHEAGLHCSAEFGDGCYDRICELEEKVKKGEL